MIGMTMMQGMGSIGLFSSRAFLPAFATAMALRYGHDLPFLKETSFFSDLPDAPTWFTHNWTITILGLLAAVEMAGTKMPEARQMLEEVDQYVKPGMAALTFLGVMGATDAEFVEKTIQQAGILESVIALPIIAGVYYIANARNGLMQLFTEADENDELGLQNLISWAEDLWSTFGVLLLIIFPVLMIILIGIVSGMIILMQKYAAYREEKAKVACRSCGEMIYPSAMACPKCKTSVEQPCKVGFFSQSKPKSPANAETHPFRLVEKKRCPVCATRFEKRDARQTCAACGHELMADSEFAKQYMNHVGMRLPLVLGVSAAFSFVPVVGLIPGVIYYRMALVAPFSRYIPLGKRIVLKWLIRLLFFVLIAFQWIPVAGTVVVPLMALISYLTYRGSYSKLIAE